MILHRQLLQVQNLIDKHSYSRRTNRNIHTSTARTRQQLFFASTGTPLGPLYEGLAPCIDRGRSIRSHTPGRADAALERRDEQPRSVPPRRRAASLRAQTRARTRVQRRRRRRQQLARASSGGRRTFLVVARHSRVRQQLPVKTLYKTGHLVGWRGRGFQTPVPRWRRRRRLRRRRRQCVPAHTRTCPRASFVSYINSQ